MIDYWKGSIAYAFDHLACFGQCRLQEIELTQSSVAKLLTQSSMLSGRPLMLPDPWHKDQALAHVVLHILSP